VCVSRRAHGERHPSECLECGLHLGQSDEPFAGMVLGDLIWLSVCCSAISSQVHSTLSGIDNASVLQSVQQ
jgi:hypothetical protein